MLLAGCASASAFRVLSGECGSTRSRDSPPVFVPGVYCVRSSNVTSCLVKPPSSVGLVANSDCLSRKGGSALVGRYLGRSARAMAEGMREGLVRLSRSVGGSSAADEGGR